MMVDTPAAAREWSLSWLFPPPELRYLASRPGWIRRMHRKIQEAQRDYPAVAREIRVLERMVEMGYL